MYANVLVEYSNKAIDKSFTYIIPPSLINSLKVGMKVKIPFNNRIINGFVIKITDNYDSDYELKSIYKIESPEIYLNKELLSIGTYLQETTLCTKIVAYQTMFPSALKIKDQEHNYNKYDTYLALNQNINLVDEYILTHKNSHA